MCGIYASISRSDFHQPGQDLKQLLYDRGPDHLGKAEDRINTEGLFCFLSFTSTVLALRGDNVATQPFVDQSSGSVLCWNGEAWKFGSETIYDGNDGQILFNALLKATTTGSTAAVLNVLGSISGPFSVVFWDKIHQQVFLGRDRLGRRSLLYRATQDLIEFSSISDWSHDADPDKGLWEEIDADGIYILSLSEHYSSEDNSQWLPSPFFVKKHPWEATLKSYVSLSSEHALMPSLGTFNRSIPVGEEILDIKTVSVQVLRSHLLESLKLRALNVQVPSGTMRDMHVRVAILFSGGLDCTVLARMVHDILPADHQIDLINVAFENPRVVQAAKAAPNSKTSKLRANTSEGISPVIEEEADLNRTEKLATSPFELCPDRETGRKAFRELARVCPARTWRFVAANIPYSETRAHKAKVVRLIYPHNTEMDLSIAYALYFASRGSGIASTNTDQTPVTYTTPARVLLSGLGADELFGGYTRHATAFNRHGFVGLLDELELDVNRLGKRNLGRDDRVISHWGREARFPYLDESLVKWAVECPIWEKCGFAKTASPVPAEVNTEAGKRVLRLLAHELGMHSVAQEKKRAIQFGARTAKMETGRTKGTSSIS